MIYHLLGGRIQDTLFSFPQSRLLVQLAELNVAFGRVEGQQAVCKWFFFSPMNEASWFSFCRNIMPERHQRTVLIVVLA